MDNDDDDDAINWVKELQAYLQIDTSTHPNINYEKCINYLINIIKRIKFNYRLYYPRDNRTPLLLVTKQGKIPASILLTSHMDVMNVGDLADWKNPPFSAHVDCDGKIYARGAQDMKSQGIQYLAALSKLSNFQNNYTIHVMFTPNKETGGYGGIADFVGTKEFRQLNIVFAINESCASPLNHFFVFYSERAVWQLKFTISSAGGNSAIPIINTCERKLIVLLQEIEQFRQTQKLINTKFVLGHTTTINMNMIHGGYAIGTLPDRLSVTFNIHVGTNTNLIAFEQLIQSWCRKASLNDQPPHDKIHYEFIRKTDQVPPTDVNNYKCLKFFKSLKRQNIIYHTTISPGSTDSIHLRNIGIPVLGFSAINNTPPLIHSKNEYISTNTFLQGIDIFCNLIRDLTQ